MQYAYSKEHLHERFIGFYGFQTKAHLDLHLTLMSSNISPRFESLRAIFGIPGHQPVSPSIIPPQCGRVKSSFTLPLLLTTIVDKGFEEAQTLLIWPIADRLRIGWRCRDPAWNRDSWRGVSASLWTGLTPPLPSSAFFSGLDYRYPGGAAPSQAKALYDLPSHSTFTSSSNSPSMAW